MKISGHGLNYGLTERFLEEKNAIYVKDDTQNSNIKLRDKTK